MTRRDDAARGTGGSPVPCSRSTSPVTAAASGVAGVSGAAGARKQATGYRRTSISAASHTRQVSRSSAAATAAGPAASIPSAPGRALAALCCAPLFREPLTAAQAEDLSRVMKALADPTRLRLVSMVAAHDGGEACVCDLTLPLGLTQPTISHQQIGR